MVTTVPVFGRQDTRAAGSGRKPVIMGTVSSCARPRVVEVHAAVRSVEAPR